MRGEKDTLDFGDVEVLSADNQMLLRKDYRPDSDDALAWVDKVWDEPLLQRGFVGDVEERRQIHDSTKAREIAMWAARSTSPSGSCSRIHHCTPMP